jgi:hypothetical protein
MPHDQDAELEAMKTTDAAMPPHGPGALAAAIRRPAPVADTKTDKPADLPQVACGGSYL